jgi:hypothetical protein
MALQVVLRPAIPVMYVESATGLAGAAEAFRQLEARLPGLKRRKFYGGWTFERMARECERDPSRPSVEFYRSQKELVLLFPVKGSGRAPQDS